MEEIGWRKQDGGDEIPEKDRGHGVDYGMHHDVDWLFVVKSTRKAASQRACPFRQNINAKYPIAPHRQTDPAVGSQTDQNGGRVGRERGKSADGCARASVSALSGDDRDRLRHMAHRLNE